MAIAVTLLMPVFEGYSRGGGVVTRNLLPAPPVGQGGRGCSLGNSGHSSHRALWLHSRIQQSPARWLVLLYIACSQPSTENITWKTPEANLGFRSEEQDDNSPLERESSFDLCKHSVCTAHSPGQQQPGHQAAASEC